MPNEKERENEIEENPNQVREPQKGEVGIDDPETEERDDEEDEEGDEEDEGDDEQEDIVQA